MKTIPPFDPAIGMGRGLCRYVHSEDLCRNRACLHCVLSTPCTVEDLQQACKQFNIKIKNIED